MSQIDEGSGGTESKVVTKEDPIVTDIATDSPPFSSKRLNSIIGYVSSVAVACAIIMWSVFNTWLNVLAYWANQDEGQAWGVAAVMVLFTCIVPLCFGLAILFNALNDNKRGRKLS